MVEKAISEQFLHILSTKIRFGVQEHYPEMGERAIELAENCMAAKRSENARNEDAEEAQEIMKPLQESRDHENLESLKEKDVKNSLASPQLKGRH